MYTIETAPNNKEIEARVKGVYPVLPHAINKTKSSESSRVYNPRADAKWYWVKYKKDLCRRQSLCNARRLKRSASDREVVTCSLLQISLLCMQDPPKMQYRKRKGQRKSIQERWGENDRSLLEQIFAKEVESFTERGPEAPFIGFADDGNDFSLGSGRGG
jgi:hypothetical protein